MCARKLYPLLCHDSCVCISSYLHVCFILLGFVSGMRVVGGSSLPPLTPSPLGNGTVFIYLLYGRECFCASSYIYFCRSFTMNTAAQCVYFFKCLYFIVSAIQIVSGYPTNILGNFLGRHYTTVSGLLFSVYRAIPLLPELREVMDWVFTDTVLPLFHWLRVQEIYSKLYLVKVRRHREKV